VNVSITDHRRYTRLSAWVALAALVLTAGALAGCGGSSTTKVTTQAARENAGLRDPDENDHAGRAPVIAPHHQSAAAHRAARAGRTLPAAHLHPRAAVLGAQAPEKRRADATGATTSAKPPRSVLAGGSQLNPCRLVSLAEAHTITGGSVQSASEAPLGPTCVYQLSGKEPDITLAVESAKLAQATHGMRPRRTVTVAGHTALCGRLGVQMLFVPLTGGRLLNVTAPCSIAQQFAGHALGRLEA
jgi:hypothetical protein